MNDADIHELKDWWRQNFAIAEQHWDAYLELGSIIKRIADEADERTKTMDDPIDWGPVEPVYRPVPSYEPRLKLDPLPYAQFYGTGREERFSASDPARVHGEFKPRPGFEQEEARYEIRPRLRRGVR